MAQIGISEFTFGFAFLREQLALQDIAGYPVLPSLSAESAFGWDAAITPTEGTVIFYQFKMSDYLEHGNSLHVSDGTYASYYRFYLHDDSDYRQHRLLKALADTLAPTYYVAPEVTTEALFSAAYSAGTVSENSRIIPLLECDDIAVGDPEQHYITYATGDTNFTFHSEPHTKQGSVNGRQLRDLYRKLLMKREPLTHDFVGSFLEKARSISSKAAPSQDMAKADLNMSHIAQFMAANFGVATVVIAERTSTH